MAAATEGYLLGTVAMSLAGKPGEHFASACLVAEQPGAVGKRRHGAGAVLLNVNVPGCATRATGPMAGDPSGRRHHAEPVVQSRNPRGETIYWCGCCRSLKMPAREPIISGG